MFRRIAIESLLVLAIGFLLGLFGPFGTYALPLGYRLGYWMLFGLAGYAIFRPLVIVGRWLSEALALASFAGVAIAQIVAAVPTTLLVGWLMSGFRIEVVLASSRLSELYAQVLLIGLIIYLLFAYLIPQRHPLTEANAVAPFPRTPVSMSVSAPAKCEPAPLAAVAADARSASPLISQLPPGFGPPLALRSEDHYVRVIGAGGSQLLLMRLRDAIAALDGLEGMQTHRSWWVARSAITAVERDGRSVRLKLTTGEVAPVSRDAAAQLKAAQWI